MITLTTDEVTVWRYLRQRASRRELTFYRDLASTLEPQLSAHVDFRAPFNPLFPMLGHISTYEVTRGRPMLSSIVIGRDTGNPGSGFFTLAAQLGFAVGDEQEFFEAQRDATFDFWSAGDPIEFLDSSLEPVFDRLDEIRKLLRKR